MQSYNKDNKSNKGYEGKGTNKSDKKGGEEKVFRGPFSSNVMGVPIVNAITGVKYPWNVGSFEENHLWKVANCMRFTPMTYFYDSPEQYETYRKVQLDPESKAVWHTLQKQLNTTNGWMI